MDGATALTSLLVWPAHTANSPKLRCWRVEVAQGDSLQRWPLQNLWESLNGDARRAESALTSTVNPVLAFTMQ